MKKAAGTVVVKQDPEKPVEKEVLAQSIVNISEAFQKLWKCGLNRQAIIVLTARSSQETQATVDRVLRALEQLKKDYTTL